MYLLKFKRRKIKGNHLSLMLNNVTIKLIKEGESYKYLGIDENIPFDGAATKEHWHLTSESGIKVNGWR